MYIILHEGVVNKYNYKVKDSKPKFIILTTYIHSLFEHDKT